MRILRVKPFHGPNIHHHLPVLVADLDLDDLARRESREFEGFNERLTELLPALHDHTCGEGYRGAFIGRLKTGTYFGHIVEHVALELSQACGIGVTYGKTRLIREPSLYAVVVRFRNEQGMRRLLEIAVQLVQAVLTERSFDLATELDAVRRLVARTDLGPSTQCIVNAARRRGIPVRRLEDGASLVQLGYGRHRRLIQAAFTDGTSGVGAELASDKQFTKQVLQSAFLPVPAGRVVSSLEEAGVAWREMGGRVAVKPIDGNQGRGVTVGINSAEALAEGFARAQAISRSVIVEEHLEGEDYRVLVVNGTMVAASLRRPPQVIGDGLRCVADLIKALNADPKRGDGHDQPLTRVDSGDPIVRDVLASQELSLESIPAQGQTVLLRHSANLSTGGTATDVTDAVHPKVRAACERAARMTGIDICGLDVITHDISQPLETSGGGIIEVNTGPGLRMHQYPSQGQPRDVGGAIVDMLFPNGSDGRIPIVAITGTNGKTTVTRMVAHALRASGASVGMTTTDGIYLNGRELARGDMTGPRSAHAILSDPAVDVAVLETARGGIVRGGLGYDEATVAVLTNVQRDHIGQDGIRDLEDLLHIKSLVVERVKEGGQIVLNADDPAVLSLAFKPRVRRHGRGIALFSMFPNKHAIRRHVAGGGRAFVPRDGWIVELTQEGATRIAQISTIPATFFGAAAFNVANALAAVAACRALGISGQLLRHALTTFEANRDNGGRMNLFTVPKGRVVVDYGHNPAAFMAVGQVVRAWRRNRTVGVVAVPGDRDNSIIEEAGRAAAKVFDRIFVKEDNDTRGRNAGETAALLCRAIASERQDLPCDVVLDEADAVRAAIDDMQHGDTVVVFYDDLDAVMTAVQACGALPLDRGAQLATSAPARYGT
jgi:cyanophycin synthetase